MAQNYLKSKTTKHALIDFIYIVIDFVGDET